MLSKSDTCLLVANHPTQIVVTRPDDVDQDDDHDEEDDKKTTTSPRSSSANNIYKMHQEIDNDNFISSTVRNSCSCRKCQRKCSLFDFDCDAKEAKTVMKYLRFRKVFSRRGISVNFDELLSSVVFCCSFQIHHHNTYLRLLN